MTSPLWWPPLSDRVELDKVVWLPITGDPFDLPLWETFKSPVVCFDRGKNAVSREVMLNSATLHKDVPIQTQHTSTYRCFPIKHKIFNRLVSESCIWDQSSSMRCYAGKSTVPFSRFQRVFANKLSFQKKKKVANVNCSENELHKNYLNNGR